jgi:periplasmic protein CpxP/Spy
MKRLGWISAVAAIVLLVTGIAFAQGGGGRRGGGPGGPGGPLFGGGAGIALRGVDLSDAQKEQIKQIVDRYQEQMRSDIMLVLTPEQQEKVKQAEAQREARLKERASQLQQRRQQRQQ